MAERGSSPETPRGEGAWTAEYFRDYLRAMSYNTWEKDSCFKYEDFRRRIELNSAWSEAFAAMRKLTAEDGREWWGLIGVTQARDRVLISQPHSFVQGSKDYVRGED